MWVGGSLPATFGEMNWLKCGFLHQLQTFGFFSGLKCGKISPRSFNWGCAMIQDDLIGHKVWTNCDGKILWIHDYTGSLQESLEGLELLWLKFE